MRASCSICIFLCRLLRSDTFNPAIRVKNAPDGKLFVIILFSWLLYLEQLTTFLNHDTLIGTSNIFHSDHNLLSEFSLVFKVHLSKETTVVKEFFFQSLKSLIVMVILRCKSLYSWSFANLLVIFIMHYKQESPRVVIPSPQNILPSPNFSHIVQYVWSSILFRFNNLTVCLFIHASWLIKQCTEKYFYH